MLGPSEKFSTDETPDFKGQRGQYLDGLHDGLTSDISPDDSAIPDFYLANEKRYHSLPLEVRRKEYKRITDKTLAALREGVSKGFYTEDDLKDFYYHITPSLKKYNLEPKSASEDGDPEIYAEYEAYSMKFVGNEESFIGSRDLKQIFALTFETHLDESTDILTDWFTYSWPKNKAKVPQGLQHLAEHITWKYALDFDIYEEILRIFQRKDGDFFRNFSRKLADAKKKDDVKNVLPFVISKIYDHLTLDT